MKKPVIFCTLAIALIYIAACGGLFVMQRSLLYFPTQEASINSAEIIYLNNDNARIKVWKMSTDQERAILYFGGNAEEVSRNILPFREFMPGYDFYFMNYRGFSGSTGSPSETAFYVDALSLYDLIAADYENISVVGRSLGSGVATYVAANREVDRLALITPYDSIVNVAHSKFPVVPVSLLLLDRYNSAGRAHNIRSPTLIVTAENDAVIPRRFTDALAGSMTNTSVNLVEIPSTNHLTVSAPVQFWEAFSEFFVQSET